MNLPHEDPHITDQELVLAADGELSKGRISEVQAHLKACWTCRTRMRELEDTIAKFIRAYHDSLDSELPPPSASRALLKARLSQLAAEHPQPAWRRFVPSTVGLRRFAYLAGSFVLALVALTLWQSFEPSLAVSPDPRLTPGAALPVTEAAICEQESARESRLVLASVGKKVFEEYGIRNPQPRRYELDYLIDPDLGGSDDASNLWPQPYSAVWNAHVKDALENRLRELVCDGTITLAQAQRDISNDWISAYKKYFRTGQPLPAHLTFRKDQPWE